MASRSFSSLHIVTPIRELCIVLIRLNKETSIINRPILGTPMAKLSLNLLVYVSLANDEHSSWEKRASELDNLLRDLSEIEEYVKIYREVEGLPIKKESTIGSLLSNIRSQAVKWLNYMRS